MPKRHLRTKPFLIGILLFCLPIAQLWATHNRAGEISIEQVGDCTSSLTVKATITTYTKASSTQADRDTLTICWGDGRCERVGRINGPGSPAKGERLENDTKKNIYVAIHTYPARGTYVISMNDPNRNGGIINVNFPNSEQIRFHIQTTYTFPNPQFQGCNNTPVLLQPPIDIGCVGEKFIHNPNAYDADGDSLSYHLIVPLQDVGLTVPNYLFPNNINPGPRNNLTINEITGDIVWDAPQRPGEYNLAMIIVEYRDGIPIDTIIRDMQILIKDCDNKPPIVDVPFDEICVIAGTVLEFPVTSTAPLDELRQQVRLTALGGPFETMINPATFTPPAQGFEEDPVTKTFRWETSCEHISDQYYSVVFKGQDNFFPDSSGLATLKTVRIKVVGPPPEGLRAVAGSGTIEVTWDKPYACDDALDNYFRGFTVWRRVNSNNFAPDTCQPGLAGRGYEKLTEFSILDMKDGRYVYVDNSVDPGRTYCYRILAEFAKTTPNGRYAYNLVESLPSEEICIQPNRDLPLVIKADVRATDPTGGTLEVCWAKSRPENLDTLTNPGPYVYELLRAEGLNPAAGAYQSIWRSNPQASFAAANDTCYLDSGLNTTGTAYSYKVNFYANANAQPLGATNPASSVFLRTSPTDRAIQLSWEFSTPWNNYAFVVWRRNAQGGLDSLATVTASNFTDRGLTNGQEYCYVIKAIGSYGIDAVPDPLINFSQEACSKPLDNVPPCAPQLQVSNLCAQGGKVNCADGFVLSNDLNWDNPIARCPEANDIAGYRIYYAEAEGAPFVLVGQPGSPNALAFGHTPPSGLAGCYAVSAVDLRGNESPLSNIVCVDNCPSYVLPNAFTPNGDGQNERFVPISSCFIERVEFKVFNRWGQLVFQTTDPQINWDGNNLNGQPLPSGPYQYVCRVFEQRVSGTIEQTTPLSGFIELLRGRE